MNAIAANDSRLHDELKTSGNFSDEPAAWVAFDAIIDRCGAFKIYREVDGQYIQPRPETENRYSRIDRVLIPTAKIIEAGWRKGGAIGVEGKRSGMKGGPLVTQAMDYSRCVFRIEHSPGALLALVMLRWVFVYPVEGAAGDLASVMGNHRIGTCWESRGELTFSCNGTNAISIDSEGKIKAKDFVMGNKRGSR